ncbi:hypothetical protein C482_19024 [Natrialba chahannaoensis JCM 10990]|uniref:Molybdopterin cofactor biosynthesis MoaD-related C-terminal domain-containing protein n=1 Tax=Natrialba chahannaoensis JCM 10990 TaxID=1227492 RepID=M0A5C7_9EURY|nr:hypothetical protein [Natrialba chahannaoensis]ELY93521.1 hypothetical protein C482_19024 [Natrialba chahannaoensis JCM 10990]
MTRRIERSFRGISERLAIRYLTNLGGTQVESTDDTVVKGDWWRAAISSESVSIGPTLTLTEVTVVFESDGKGHETDDDGDRSETNANTATTTTTTDPLEALVEDFAQKAMRAGG